MTHETLGIDAHVRHHVYAWTLRTGMPPSTTAIAAVTNGSADDVRASLERLAAARVVVLQPHSGELLMVPPFSAVPTPFLVDASSHRSYANCAWDALGVPVMLREPARILSACACCGEALQVDTHRDTPPDGEGVIHFAIPARRWWEDIVFT